MRGLGDCLQAALIRYLFRAGSWPLAVKSDGWNGYTVLVLEVDICSQPGKTLTFLLRGILPAGPRDQAGAFKCAETATIRSN